MNLVENLKALTLLHDRQPEQWGDDLFMPSPTVLSWGPTKEIAADFDSVCGAAYKKSGPVFACIMARGMTFRQARFLYQEELDGNPGKLVDGPGLELLRRPAPGMTRSAMLMRAEQGASLAGNAYFTPVGTGANRRLRQLRPNWVTIISGVLGDPEASPFDLEAEVIAYIYRHPKSREGIVLNPRRVLHYAPIPDPEAQWRGMSWLSSVLPEVAADRAMTSHKLRFMQQGATLNFAIAYDKAIPPAMVREYAAQFAEQHEGEVNAYKALHIGGGADPKTIGSSIKDLDFKAVQGAGETRIAAASGVGAILARFSEGMQGSSLNQGNYDAAKRQFADMTVRPLWDEFCGAAEHLTTPPEGAHLAADTRDVEFLKADRKATAEVQQAESVVMKTLVDGGWTPASIVAAVQAQDWSLLEHSGKTSVQLQPMDGATEPAPGSESTTDDGDSA